MIPKFLEEKLIKQYGQNLTEKIIDGYSSRRKTTLRVNTIKSNVEEIKGNLESEGIVCRETEWNKNAIIIENADEEKMKTLDIYKEGKIYLQSLSSMIPAVIVEPKEKENILDMAAAPGGKTTQMASLSNNKAMITACEKNKIRAERLKYNLEKQGATHVNVMIEDARKLNDFFSFDKILLDVPCSGSGTININDSKLSKYYTQELVSRSIKTQKELLLKASKIIKNGGEIIYSTCSILKEENEEVVKEVMKKANLELVPINVEEFENIPMLTTELEGTICICPDELYEGFFVAKLRENN